MGKKLFVGSISFQASEEDLKNLFSQVGGVESVKIITDPDTGRSKGFGFVEMTEDEGAQKAIADLNGASLMDRTIVVNEARPKQPREKRSFGAGRGGYGGDDRDGRGGFNKRKGAGNRRGRR